MRRIALAALLLAVVNSACDEPSGPPDATPDASFISADAEPAPDAGAADAGGGPSDAEAGDGAAADGGDPLDAGPMDADNPCAAPPVRTLSASTAADQAQALAGQLVALTGTATTTTLECTDRACPEDDPCCNTCTARIRVGDVLLAPSECSNTTPGCAGNECSQTCRPPLFGLPQTFRGVLSTAAADLELLLYGIR